MSTARAAIDKALKPSAQEVPTGTATLLEGGSAALPVKNAENSSIQRAVAQISQTSQAGSRQRLFRQAVSQSHNSNQLAATIARQVATNQPAVVQRLAADKPALVNIETQAGDAAPLETAAISLKGANKPQLEVSLALPSAVPDFGLGSLAQSQTSAPDAAKLGINLSEFVALGPSNEGVSEQSSSSATGGSSIQRTFDGGVLQRSFVDDGLNALQNLGQTAQQAWNTGTQQLQNWTSQQAQTLQSWAGQTVSDLQQSWHSTIDWVRQQGQQAAQWTQQQWEQIKQWWNGNIVAPLRGWWHSNDLVNWWLNGPKDQLQSAWNSVYSSLDAAGWGRYIDMQKLHKNWWNDELFNLEASWKQSAIPNITNWWNGIIKSATTWWSNLYYNPAQLAQEIHALPGLFVNSIRNIQQETVDMLGKWWQSKYNALVQGLQKIVQDVQREQQRQAAAQRQRQAAEEQQRQREQAQAAAQQKQREQAQAAAQQRQREQTQVQAAVPQSPSPAASGVTANSSQTAAQSAIAGASNAAPGPVASEPLLPGTNRTATQQHLLDKAQATPEPANPPEWHADDVIGNEIMKKLGRPTNEQAEKRNQFIQAYQQTIRAAAADTGIPDYLIALALMHEVTGKPAEVKYLTYVLRRIGIDPESPLHPNGPERTSIKPTAVQVGRAAEIMGHGNHPSTEVLDEVFMELHDMRNAIFVVAGYFKLAVSKVYPGKTYNELNQTQKEIIAGTWRWGWGDDRHPPVSPQTFIKNHPDVLKEGRDFISSSAIELARHLLSEQYVPSPPKPDPNSYMLPTNLP